MELDELKKSWNVLNKHLEEKKIIDEEALNKLIAQRTHQTKGGISRITSLEKLSILCGIVLTLLGIISCFILPKYITTAEGWTKAIYAGTFTVITLIFGMWWDVRTYLWLKNTNIEDMPTVTVIKRINKFRSWIKYEITAFVIWLILFLGLFYWIEKLYLLPNIVQILLFVFWIAVIVGSAYFIYKKLIYDRIKDIKKNLDELDELKKNL